MSKYKTLSLHYVHHPEHVLKIHKSLANLLNQRKGFKLGEPKLKRVKLLKLQYVSEKQGIRIRTTTKEAHDNFLILDINKRKFPYLSRCNDLRKLGLLGIEEILGNPTTN